MRRCASVLTIALTATLAGAADLPSREANRVQESAMVLKEIRQVPDKGIPRELWDKAECVVVVPSVKKAAFVLGGEYGRGLMSCRRDGRWGAPLFMLLEKGSWGIQIGAQTIDLVLLVMNGAGKLLGDKVTLGVEASIAAGPVGRDARAATDAQMKAEILAYSRAQGLFAGVNLSGGVLKPDTSPNADTYGKTVTPRDIVTGSAVAPPRGTEAFMTALEEKPK
jgi:lipid-binding SYLF domain-containing protein